jgi:multiple sugar transport system permease protein
LKNARSRMLTPTEKSKRKMMWICVLPALLFTSVLVIYPLLDIIYLSFKEIKFFGDVNVKPGFTLANYDRVLNLKNFWNALKNTIYYTAMSILISFVFGFSLALLLNQKVRGKRLFEVLLLLAWPIPGVVVSLLFMWMFDSNFGIINIILRSLSIIQSNIPWFTNANTAFGAVIVATAWKLYPFFTLMLYAGIQAIPLEYYESAKIDGAGVFARFFHITIPALRQIIAISMMQQILWVFRNYDLIAVLTGGGPGRATETLPMLLYNEAFNYSRMGSATAIGVLGLIVCTLIVLVFMPVVKKEFF